MNILEDLIHKHAPISSIPTSSGWHTLKCAVCDDYKTRAGFKFEHDTVAYHCFNCTFTAGYDPEKYQFLSSNMIDLLDAFHIDPSEYRQVELEALKHHKHPTASKVKQDPNTELVEVAMPDYFEPLATSNSKWAPVIKKYVTNVRKVELDKANFHIVKDSASDFMLKQWAGYLIIPFYRNGKLVWYQGRDVTDTRPQKYKNLNVDSQCILSDYDILTKDRQSPIFVIEGIFDAWSVGGVAIFGNKIKAGQATLLNKSSKRKIYIPDTTGNGDVGARQALEYGWDISLPDIGRCKDVDDAVKTYGKLYVTHSILQNAVGGVEAEIQLSVLCN